MPVPEEKEKIRKLDLSKLKNPLIREITTSTLYHQLEVTPPWPVSWQPQRHHLQPKHAKDGDDLACLCSICPTPLPSGLRLISGRLLGQRNREEEEEGETQEGRGDEAKA